MILYRGFNNNYPKTLGVRPEQKGIWLTEDYDFAKLYANYFKNGAIAEVELDDNANIANEYDCISIFEDDEDWQDAVDYICDLGADVNMDNQICDKLANSGYDGVMFDDSGRDCFYIFNRKIIKRYKIVELLFNNSEDAMESQIKNILRNAGVKQLNEGIIFNDEVYNDFEEKYDKLTVILNPSIDWLRNKLNKPDAWGFRFLHNVEKNKLYVWDTHQSWMHQQVFDIVNMDWGKPGMNVVGIFEPEGVAVWEELADDGKRESSIALAKKLDGKLFDELYPNGYEIYTCS